MAIDQNENILKIQTAATSLDAARLHRTLLSGMRYVILQHENEQIPFLYKKVKRGVHFVANGYRID